MGDKKFEGIDWNRNGKRDMGDRYIEMKIIEKINEEEEKKKAADWFIDSFSELMGCIR